MIKQYEGQYLLQVTYIFIGLSDTVLIILISADIDV